MVSGVPETSGLITTVPVLPSLVACTTTEPEPSTDTRPVADTVPTDAAESVAHVMARPVTTALFASRSVAVSCWVPPTATVELTGPIVTVFTGRLMTSTVRL